MTLPPWTVEPIGYVRSPFRERREAPRQPPAAAGVRATIELLPGRGFEDAVDDLARWDHVWVLFWFHEAEGWRPKVTPPRSEVKRGLFATRAPHRPNPIGMSAVRLERVDGLVLHIANVDMIDGTPVLDIKPYVPYADAIPDANSGWLADDPAPPWSVAMSELADAQLAFLRDAHGIDLREPIASVLELGPQPHAYRRIKRDGPDRYRLAIKEWRARFRVDGQVVTVLEIGTGYRAGQLAGGAPELAAHRAFVERFGPGAIHA